MNDSKIMTWLGCCAFALILLWGMLPAQSAVAEATSVDGEFPQAFVEAPSPHQVTFVEQALLLRDQGVEAMQAYVATLDAETRAVLQPELDALLQPASTHSVETIEVTPYVGINNGGCLYDSIQDALVDAIADDTIQVTGGTHYDNPNLEFETLTIRGGYDADCQTHSGGVTTLDGDGSTSVFDISGSTVTLQDFIITDGGGSGAGVDAFNGSHVTLDNTQVTLNNGVIGGGIYASGSSYVTATNDSAISQNTATLFGGGVAVYNEFHAYGNYSDIFQNIAPHGGGMYANGADVFINAADLYQNQATAADGKGGAIYAIGNSKLTLTNSCFVYYQNIAFNGAGIYADHSQLDLTNTVFRENQASNNGGAVYMVNDSTFNGLRTDIGQLNVALPNTAVTGAGIFAMTSTVTLNNGAIVNNVAEGSGGGIYADASAITLTNMTVGGSADNANGLTSNNTAFGAGVYLNDNSQATLQDTTISYNQPTGSPDYAGGSGVYVNDSTLTAKDSRIDKNTAVANTIGRGGGLYISNGTVTLTDSGVYSNVTSHVGGGIRVYGPSTLTMVGSTVQNNKSAVSEGGGIAAIFSAFGPPEINLLSTVFYSNSAETSGGAIYMDTGTIDVDGAWLFDYNKAKVNGGAIATNNVTLTVDTDYALCDPSLAECNVFTANYADHDNNATGYGGAIYALESSVAINHARFYQNEAVRGGAIFGEGTTADLQVKNTLMFDNHSTQPYGAAIRAVGGTVLLQHVTLVENTGAAGYSQSATDATVDQSIAWGNDSGGFWFTSGTMIGTCNIDQSSKVGVYQDPIFVDAGADDFRLHYTSPAMDACAGGLPVDLDGNARPIGLAYDMGAYEREWDRTFLPINLRDSN